MLLEISTHDGKVYEVDEPNYNPEELSAKLNDYEILTVVIGKLVMSRVNVKSIVPKG